MSLLPRMNFPLPGRTPSWFAGHMAKSLRELPGLLKDVDLVIEARDARLPLTSVNPAFDEVLEGVWGKRVDLGGSGRKKKLVVYTKRDLAEKRFEQPLRKAMAAHASQEVVFADTRVDRDVRSILRYSVDMGKTTDDEMMGDLKVLVVGMPNVGKSSLLNALRRVGVHKGKAFRIGAEPGITKRLTGTVKIHEDPNVYVYDTPGVMVSYLGKGKEGAEKGLKLALTAGIKASLFEDEVVADYLLYRLNIRHWETGGRESYTNQLPLPSTFVNPTDSLHVLLDALARRLGALKSGGQPDIETAQTFFLRSFREGKFGQWTLDDLISSSPEVDPTIDQDPMLLVHSPSIVTEVSSSDLDSRVSNTVQSFLVRQEHERHQRAEGVPISATQGKKQLKATRIAERAAKAKMRFEGRIGVVNKAKPRGSKR